MKQSFIQKYIWEQISPWQYVLLLDKYVQTTLETMYYSITFMMKKGAIAAFFQYILNTTNVWCKLVSET